MHAPKKSYDREDRPGAPIAAIEYQHRGKLGWVPHSVEADGDTYDFDYLDHDMEITWHNSGSGPFDKTYGVSAYCNAPKLCAKLWLAPGIKLIHNKKEITAEEAVLLGYKIIKEPIERNGETNPFEYAIEAEGGTEWCTVCQSPFRDDHTCRHLQYEEGNGHTLGCGSGEVDIAQTQQSLYRLLRTLPQKSVAELHKSLSSGKYHTHHTDSMLGGDQKQHFHPHGPCIFTEYLGEELNYEERYWPGIAWLQSLDLDAKDAIALTRGWLWAWKLSSWRNSCVLPLTTLYREVPAKQLSPWLALDPASPSDLEEKPFRIGLNFKTNTRNCIDFKKNPKGCEEITLHNGGTGANYHSITFSVADVKFVARNLVDIYFGRVLEKNGKHISELPDYHLV